MAQVKIWDHLIGEGAPPFFVAELGICHGGSLATALELTRHAAAAGAHCVKTETFQRATLVFDPRATASYSIKGQKITVPLAEHMDKYGLDLTEHAAIKRLCDELKIPFMSTAHDFKSIDFLKEIGAAAVKLASPDLVHYPLLRHAAASGLPVFLDTGAATQVEIELAVETLKQGNAAGIVLNHNPDGHPAGPAGQNLAAIARLKSLLQVPVGLACHYEGYQMLYCAVAAGADTVEKPISLDRFVEEPERNWSISVADLAEVIEKTARAHQALGCPERKLSAQQIHYRDMNRCALVAARDLLAGEELTLDKVLFGRPRKGIGVEHWDLVAGRPMRRPLARHQFIQWKDLD